MSDLIERLKGLQEWYSRNTGEGILHAVHLNALSEVIAALSPALPDDVAKYVADLRDPPVYYTFYPKFTEFCNLTADLLERQARVYKSCCKDREVLLNLANKDRQRIEELEAEIEDLGADLSAEVQFGGE